MSLFKMLVVVREGLDCILRNFLWEGQSSGRKIDLMKWSDVIKPISPGGVSFGSLELKSWAILAKWSFGEEMNALWRKVVASKYGEGK